MHDLRLRDINAGLGQLAPFLSFPAILYDRFLKRMGCNFRNEASAETACGSVFLKIRDSCDGLSLNQEPESSGVGRIEMLDGSKG